MTTNIHEDLKIPVEEEDFVFRFRIGPPPGEGDPDTLVRILLEEILAVVELTHKGKAVRVDGFRLLANPSTIHKCCPRADEGKGGVVDAATRYACKPDRPLCANRCVGAEGHGGRYSPGSR